MTSDRAYGVRVTTERHLLVSVWQLCDI